MNGSVDGSNDGADGVGKLWAEAIENIPPGPLEAAAATGASRLKVIAFAFLPDAGPSMVSVGLFWWEFNVRASTVLGVVGAGGIGQELKNSMDLPGRWSSARAGSPSGILRVCPR